MINRPHLLRPMLMRSVFAVLVSCTNGSDSQSEPPITNDRASASASSAESLHLLRPTRGIRGVFEDRLGRFWFSSPDWTCCYDSSVKDAADGGLRYFGTEANGVGMNGFQEDSTGRILAQSAGGVHAFDGHRFGPIPIKKDDTGHAWSMADGDLWFGADRGELIRAEDGRWGAYRYRDGACTFLPFPVSPGNRHHFYLMNSRPMYGKDGTLWLGSFEAAFGFNGAFFDIVGRERMGLAAEARDIGIRGYHLDRRGNLWMADNGLGVFVYDGKTVVHFTALHGLRDEDTEGHSLLRAFSIAEDSAGHFWFGTVYSGIWRYEPSAEDPIGKGRFTNFAGDPRYPTQHIWTIYKTRSGELLFAAEDPGGVYRFNGEAFERIF